MSDIDIPWITATLALGMGAIHLVSPVITPVSYTILAPWLHAGFGHLWENLLVFVLLGTWVEWRVGWVTFLVAALLIPYLALYLPVVFNYGGLATGASGLTKALTGYALPAGLVILLERIESGEVAARDVVVGLGLILFLVYLTVDAWVTVQRFLGLVSRPPGKAVSAHVTGLGLGVLWFGWRAWQHELDVA